MSAASMEVIAEGLPTKSAKIRALAAAGFARADIARFLNIRYQHVRNVLADEARASGTSLTRSPQPGDQVRVQVSSGGRIVIPSEFRNFLKIDEGSSLILELTEDGLVLRPASAQLRSLQEALSPYLQNTGSLADELISERRRDAD